MYKRFVEWSKAGIFKKIFEDLSVDEDMQNISIDSTCIIVHKASAGAKKKNPDHAKTSPKVNELNERFEKNQYIGITRGGRNTKIHPVVDALGNPIYVQLSLGDIHDLVIAEDALSHINLNGTTVLANKTDGSYELREYIVNHNADFCIPPKSNAIDPCFCGWVQYKERHLVECFFNKLKENCRLAIRFDKLASRFLSFVFLGCIRILLA